MPEMETLNTRQWYAVHRYDGNVQYAVKYDDLYFLWGSGFGISKFDADLVSDDSRTRLPFCSPVESLKVKFVPTKPIRSRFP